MSDVTPPSDPSARPQPSAGTPLARPRRRRGFVWPILLIFIGSVFLLGNFGLLAPSAGLALARLWPLILILVGVDLILAPRAPLAALVADLAIVGLGLGLALLQPARGPFVPFVFDGASAPGQGSVIVAREQARSLELRVSGGGGTYHFSGGATALVEAASDHDDLVLRLGRSAERVNATLQQTGISFGAAPANVTIRVASDVPTSLRLEAGAGDFTVDLRDVLVTEARLSIGASSVLISLPKTTGDVPVRIDSGATNIAIEVPDGVEARVSTTGGLLSLHSGNPRVVERSGGIAETAGYMSARDRVTVTVSAGVTSVTIR